MVEDGKVGCFFAIYSLDMTFLHDVYTQMFISHKHTRPFKPKHCLHMYSTITVEKNIYLANENESFHLL